MRVLFTRRDGEANDGEIIPFDLFDKFGADPLYPVGPGFVEGLTGSNVFVDLTWGQLPECDVGFFIKTVYFAPW